MDFDITPTILKRTARIHTLQERFSNLPLEPSWSREIQESSIVADTIATYKLDGGNENIKDIKDILGVESLKDRQILLNEYELRKSFSLYFKSKEFKVEDLNYVHRLLDNLQDETAEDRGNLRKEQEIIDGEVLPGLMEIIPRYGFLRREIEDFLEQINNGKNHYLISAGIIHLGIIKISPYIRSNFRLARALSRGYLFANGFDPNQFLSLDTVFALDGDKYLRILQKGLQGDLTKWLEYYLECVLQSFELLANRVEIVSGGSIRPLDKEVIPLTKRQKTIVELLKRNNQMSGSEIAAILGVTRQNIHVIMQKLLKKKIIEKLGKGTASRYRLKI